MGKNQVQISVQLSLRVTSGEVVKTRGVTVKTKKQLNSGTGINSRKISDIA